MTVQSGRPHREAHAHGSRFIPWVMSIGMHLGLIAIGMLITWTVIIAQDIADIPLSSGWLFRICLGTICLAVGVHHILRYAKKIQADPSRSLVADIDYSSGFKLAEDVPLTLRRQPDSWSTPLKKLYAQFTLQSLNLQRYRWLAEKELLSRPGDTAKTGGIAKSP